MNINNLINTLLISYTVSKLINKNEIEDIKTNVYKKIFDILNYLNFDNKKINFLFKIENLDDTDTIDKRIEGLVLDIEKENIKQMPKQIFNLLKQKK